MKKLIALALSALLLFALLTGCAQKEDEPAAAESAQPAAEAPAEAPRTKKLPQPSLPRSLRKNRLPPCPTASIPLNSTLTAACSTRTKPVTARAR